MHADERSCHTACVGKRRAKLVLSCRTHSQVMRAFLYRGVGRNEEDYEAALALEQKAPKKDAQAALG
jgi:hypothetical protein